MSGRPYFRIRAAQARNSLLDRAVRMYIHLVGKGRQRKTVLSGAVSPLMQEGTHGRLQQSMGVGDRGVQRVWRPFRPAPGRKEGESRAGRTPDRTDGSPGDRAKTATRGAGRGAGSGLVAVRSGSRSQISAGRA